MTSYKNAGVDIKASYESVKKIKIYAKDTFNKSVLQGVGAFSGAMDVSFLKKFKTPVLVSTIDGVGTKVKLATQSNVWHTIGQDIVNHCSNDLLVHGAKPLFFLDYLAFSSLAPKKVTQIVRGMSIACKKLGCVLIGGETAQMPEVYRKKEFDIAGCMVGATDEKNLVTGKSIMVGDILIGLGSNGLHTNGFSLARKVLLKKKNKKILKELLKIHKSYSKNVLALLKKVKINGMVHVTGGGLIDNTPRILPQRMGVLINKSSFKPPKIFSLIQKKGHVSEAEMFRTFNMGIGFVIVVSPKHAKKAVSFLKKRKEKVFLIGKVIKERLSRALFYG